MGSSMTWKRLVHRNGATGGYDGTSEYGDDVGAPQWMTMDPERFRERPLDPVRPEHQNYLAGDLRRLEGDQRDAQHLLERAQRTGLTPDQVKAVLDDFFESDW